MARKPGPKPRFLELKLDDFVRFVLLAKQLDDGSITTREEIAKNWPGKWSPSQVGRWIARLEACVGKKNLIKKFGKRGFGKLEDTEIARRFLQAAEALAVEAHRQSEALAIQKPTGQLKVALSETVFTYLLPLLLPKINQVLSPGCKLDPFHFQPDKLGQMDENKPFFDVAVTWHGFGERINKPNVIAEPLKESDTPVCLIYHPFHPFGVWIRDFGAKPSNRKRLLKEIEGHAIIYPDIDQLVSIAGALKPRQQLRVFGLPAVVSLVRHKFGIGLFPGWEWLLRQLERETYIQWRELPSLGPGFDLRMMLTVLWPRASQDQPNPNAKAFVRLLKEEVNELSDSVGTWHCQPWSSLSDYPFLDGHRFRSHWHFYYVTTGERNEDRVTKWHRGEMIFSPPKGIETRINAFIENSRKGSANIGLDPISGAVTIPRVRPGKPAEPEEPAKYVIDARFGSDFADILSIPEPGSPPHRKKSFISLSHRAEKDGYSGVCLLGSIHFTDNRGRAAVGPFLLCSKPMSFTVEDYRQLGSLVGFLHHTEGINHESSKDT